MQDRQIKHAGSLLAIYSYILYRKKHAGSSIEKASDWQGPVRVYGRPVSWMSVRSPRFLDVDPFPVSIEIHCSTRYYGVRSGSPQLYCATLTCADRFAIKQ